MAGKTEFGPEAAEETLFEGARWVIVPAVEASSEAITIITNIAKTLGATPMVMDAEEHDAYVAAISHLPMMAAMALFSMGRASEAWPELSLLAAGGFRDMTRLAGTDPDMAYDIAMTNKENIAHWIDRYVVALQELRRRLVDVEGEDEFYRLLAATNLDTIVGNVNWGGGDLNPVKNVVRTPLVAGQWQLADGKPNLVITNNKEAPEIPVGGEMKLIG